MMWGADGLLCVCMPILDAPSLPWGNVVILPTAPPIAASNSPLCLLPPFSLFRYCCTLCAGALQTYLRQLDQPAEGDLRWCHTQPLECAFGLIELQSVITL